jgi:hypothetical protein
MNIEKQVCTWEQGLKLQQLGVENNSYFTWMEYLLSNDGDNFHKWWAVCRPNVGEYDFMTDATLPEGYEDLEEWETERECGAWAVAELGEMIKMIGLYTCVNTVLGGWAVHHVNGYKEFEFPQPGNVNSYDTEAEARAAILIHLLESKLISASEVNQRLKQ